MTATRNGPVFRWLGWRFIEQFLGDEDPRQVNTIYQDSGGPMWFGGSRGLFRSTGPSISPVGPEAGFPGGEVTVMAGGTKGELWLGTDQGFVLRDSDGRLQTVGSPGDHLRETPRPLPHRSRRELPRLRPPTAVAVAEPERALEKVDLGCPHGATIVLHLLPSGSIPARNQASLECFH